MRNGRTLLVAGLIFHFALPVFGGQVKRFPLAPGAVIRVGEKTVGHVESDAEMCKGYSVTKREIRRYFATYKLIDGHEKHYLYQEAACYIRGTVMVNSKTFMWIVNPGGTLQTTYPDGVQKDLGTTDPSMLDIANE